MNLNTRELTLALITLIVVLCGVTYYVGKAKVAEYRETREEVNMTDQKLKKLQAMFNRKDQIENRFNELISTLPVHPEDADVTADTLRRIQELARQHQLSLLSLDSKDEKQVGDLNLFELGISCDYEGTLEAVVRFLYAIQTDENVMDIRQFDISKKARTHNIFKGKFVVDCAYLRGQPDTQPQTSTETTSFKEKS